jgi:hypothetical protein
MAHHGGTDNGRLPITYQNFEDYGMDRDAIAPAIRECEALGFIEVTVHGRAGNAEFRAPNMFRLTYRHCKDVDGDGTHEWARIKTNAEALAVAKAARKTPQKNRIPHGKIHPQQSGRSPPNAKIPTRENPDYSHSRNNPTTLDILGGDEHAGEDAVSCVSVGDEDATWTL